MSDSKEALAAGVAGAKKGRWDAIYALKGTKHLEQRKMIGTDGSALADRDLSPSLSLYDGRHNHMVTNMHVVSGKIIPEGEDQTRDTMTNTPERTFPSPLDFGYRTETDWIGDLLSSGDFKVDGIEQSPQFGQLLRVQGQHENKQQQLNYQITFWFAPKYGFVSVRTEISTNQTKDTYQVEI